LGTTAASSMVGASTQLTAADQAQAAAIAAQMQKQAQIQAANIATMNAAQARSIFVAQQNAAINAAKATHNASSAMTKYATGQ